MPNKKVRHSANNIEPTEEQEQFRNFPLYILLSCGILIIIAGIWLILSNTTATGITFPGKYGEGGGKHIGVNGTYAIIIGILICIFPSFQLIKNSKRKKLTK